ncbi:MAG TPA: GNAT family N-acetyltransferase [Telmatospirillum sp.]|nr:GNAT family N-acetyltransferase [Telmatospirillum sp.]
MTIDLQPIAPAHAAVLAAMHRICFAEPWDEKAMSELLAMPGAFGFLAAPKPGEAHPQGFILCRTAGDEAEVLTVLVLPPCRRRGVATALLARATEMAGQAGATVLFLEVAADNDSARHLYSTQGFEQVGCRPRYYGNAIDALVMKRSLAMEAGEVMPS